MGEEKNKNPLLTATVLPTEGKIKHCSLNPLLPQAVKKLGLYPFIPFSLGGEGQDEGMPFKF